MTPVTNLLNAQVLLPYGQTYDVNLSALINIYSARNGGQSNWESFDQTVERRERLSHESAVLTSYEKRANADYKAV